MQVSFVTAFVWRRLWMRKNSVEARIEERPE